MTVNEAITELGAIKPHAFTDDVICKWLTQLDGQLWEDVVKWHRFPLVKDEDGHRHPMIPEHGPYTEADMEKKLMVPEPYDDVYIKWLSAQIDYNNHDIGRYNNSMVMYNEALKSYTNWLNRTFLPLQRAYIETRVRE